MSEPTRPGDDKKTSSPPLSRIAIWVIVGGIGLYLVITGVVGILTKAQ
ncbi:MAG: hypothetical protein JWP19_758 [Rhodoglobus sp.]|jgi:hypothetical protein|nr:hypothetical protein [Rhodoglobus sp.]